MYNPRELPLCETDTCTVLLLVRLSATAADLEERQCSFSTGDGVATSSAAGGFLSALRAGRWQTCISVCIRRDAAAAVFTNSGFAVHPLERIMQMLRSLDYSRSDSYMLLPATRMHQLCPCFWRHLTSTHSVRIADSARVQLCAVQLGTIRKYTFSERWRLPSVGTGRD